MSAVLTLALKELRLLVRDRFALFWIIAFPLMFALFFGVLFGNDDDEGRGALALTVIDQDQSAGSRAVVARLARNDSVELTRVGEEPDAPLESLSPEEAREAVRKGRRVAYLLIPAGYGDNPWALFGARDASGGEGAVIEIGIDPGRRAEAGFLQGVLMEAVFGALQDRFRQKETLREDILAARDGLRDAPGLGTGQRIVLETFFGALDSFLDGIDLDALTTGDGEGGSGGLAQPFEIVDVSRDRSDQPRTSFDITFPQALVWGLMSVALTFAITLVRERTSGTLLRLRMAPISRAQLLGGKALGCFLGCAGTMVGLLAFGWAALGVRFDSLPLLFLAIACIAACFTGIMMTISVLGKTEAAVAGASWGLLMPFAMIGGGMIPLIAMPGWLVRLSAISPFKWAILAIEGAAWRGFGPTDMLLPCSVLVAIGGVCFALGVAIFRRIDP